MICLSISEKNPQKIMEMIENAEIAEIRLDLCELTEDQIKKVFSSNKRLIATCRPGIFDEDYRKKILKTAIDSGTANIDIELESVQNDLDFEEIVKLAKSKNCRVIISYHNFDDTPSKDLLVTKINEILRFDPEIIKIACQANDIKDCRTILSLYDLEKDIIGNKEMISIGMGESGRITRIAAIFLGAPFTYASTTSGDETADGQCDYKTIKEMLRVLGENKS